MGLDNGICVKRNEETSKIPELRRFAESYDKEGKYDFEIAYWRKCWNIRNDILWILGHGQGEEYTYSITKESLNQVIKLLESYNSENFEGGGVCIWDWDDPKWPYSAQIAYDIGNLRQLRKLMDKYDLKVYFYDSY